MVWPKVEQLWEVVGDSAAEHVFRSVANTDEYILATRYFCGRLQPIVRGLSIEELSSIGRATMPPFFSTLPNAEQNVMTEGLEAA